MSVVDHRRPTPSAVRAGAFVDNTPFRELAFRMLDSGRAESWADLAARCGYPPRFRGADSTALRRSLGVSKEGGKGGCRRFMARDVAVRFVRACGEAPMDYGL